MSHAISIIIAEVYVERCANEEREELREKWFRVGYGRLWKWRERKYKRKEKFERLGIEKSSELHSDEHLISISWITFITFMPNFFLSFFSIRLFFFAIFFLFEEKVETFIGDEKVKELEILTIFSFFSFHFFLTFFCSKPHLWWWLFKSHINCLAFIHWEWRLSRFIGMEKFELTWSLFVYD